MVENIIESFDITKKFKLRKSNEKEIIALNNVNLSIKKGEKFGLLGPNGAGKTTFIQIISTLMQPTSGYANINGYNIKKYPKKAKSNIALMLGATMIYYRMTAHDNLIFFGKIYKVPNYRQKIIEIAKEFEFEKWLNQYVETFSSGMKMKLALCRTFLLDREIAILDEPTLGLDVQLKDFIVKKLKNSENTILLTSHDMGVVEKLCDRIAFINKGSILKIGLKEDLKHLMKAEVKFDVMINNGKDFLKKELEQQNFIKEIDDGKEKLTVNVKDREHVNKLLLILGKYKVLSINEQELSLEDLFFKINA